METTAFSSTQTISLAVLPSDVSALLAAGARGDLRLVVPADDVELVYEPAAAAPTEVLAEGESDLGAAPRKTGTDTESEKAEE